VPSESAAPAIEYVVGDATTPTRRPAIIVHVCNDIGGWGAGFVLALSRRWPEPEAEYRAWSRAVDDRLPLGEVQLVAVEPELWVANLVGQRDIRRAPDGSPPVRYDAIRQGLRAVAEHAISHRASVHMPRIGCGLAGGEWSVVAEIVHDELVDVDVEVVVYDLPAR
jgi:O-acetyl-ADP-ribose deacetylase (regulator of RNase III)